MRVAFVSPRFFPCLGGYENYVLEVARQLLAVGHKVAVFTTTALDLEYFWLESFKHLEEGSDAYEGIEIHRFPICHRRWLRRASRLLSLLPSWRLKAQFARPSFRVPGLEKSLASFKPDVVHVGPLPYNSLMYCGIRAARKVGARALVTPCTHFGPDDTREVSQHYTRPFQIALLGSCDRVLTLTAVERTRLCELGLRPERVIHTGAGIHLERAAGGDGKRARAQLGVSGPIVLHLGMKAPEKGTVTLLEAMNRLWTKGFRATLILAGPEISSFRNQLESFKNGSALIDLDIVQDAQKLDLLAAADIVVQPSCVESLGLVYLEAWANHKPVIAADIPTSRELITGGEEGLLVRYGDADQLAVAIQFLLENLDQRKKMGVNGHNKLSQSFTWAQISPRLISYIVDKNHSSHR